MADKQAVFITGATGFVGGHLAAQLVRRGEKVRVLCRKNSSLRNLEGLAVEPVYGDLQDQESLVQGMQGCRQVYHVAADYRLWSPDPSELYLNNLIGTRNILQAARRTKIQRMVYTSTVGALGFTSNGTPADEETPVSLSDMIGHYKRSKFMAEVEVQAAAAGGFPVVIVNPSTPVGSGDLKPTPTGQIIVQFLNGKMPAYMDTGLNLVDVEDVAQGHLSAMEKGKVGERYILGNRNLTLHQILEILSQISGRPVPKVKLPWVGAMGIAAVCTGVSSVTKQTPLVSLEAARMSRKKMFFSQAKAVRDLDLPQTPVEKALEKAVRWFRDNGYAK